MRWRQILLVFAFSTLCLSACASAGVGDDNDANYPEVGSEWVENYVWPSGPNPYGAEDAQGFARTLRNDGGWNWPFDYGNDSAEHYHWTWANDASYADSVDAMYFSGHASSEYIKLATFPDNWAYFEVCSWGDYDLEWIFLHGCESTHAPSNFKGYPRWALNGAHLICGFDTSSYNYAEDGTNVASTLLSGIKVRPAWFVGVDVMQPSDVRVRIIGEDSTMGDDFIWKEGTVKPDPIVDSSIYSWLYYCN